MYNKTSNTNSMPTVSAIIRNDSNTNQFLQRCIGMLKRQSYSNIEILLENDVISFPVNDSSLYCLKSQKTFSDLLSQILTIINGEYIVFFNPSQVIETTYIESLINCIQNLEDCFIGTSTFFNIERNENEIYLSINGKLFPRKGVSQMIEDKDKEDYSFSEADFLFWALNNLSYIELDESCFVYNDMYLNNKYHDFYTMPLNFKWISSLKKLSSTRSKQIIIKALNNPGNRESLFSIIIEIALEFSTDIELHYYIATNHLSNIYKDALKGDEDAYYCCAKYLSCFLGNELFLRVILDAIGMNNDQFELMNKLSLNEYLFYYDKLSGDNKKEEKYLIAQIEKIENKVKNLEKQLLEQSQMGKKLNDQLDVSIESETQEKTGPELADYVVQQFIDGKLGFKTIMRAVKAWKFSKRKA